MIRMIYIIFLYVLFSCGSFAHECSKEMTEKLDEAKKVFNLTGSFENYSQALVKLIDEEQNCMETYLRLTSIYISGVKYQDFLTLTVNLKKQYPNNEYLLAVELMGYLLLNEFDKLIAQAIPLINSEDADVKNLAYELLETVYMEMKDYPKVAQYNNEHIEFNQKLVDNGEKSMSIFFI